MKEKIILALIRKLLTKERLIKIMRTVAALTKTTVDDRIVEQAAQWLGVE